MKNPLKKKKLEHLLTISEGNRLAMIEIAKLRLQQLEENQRQELLALKQEFQARIESLQNELAQRELEIRKKYEGKIKEMRDLIKKMGGQIKEKEGEKYGIRHSEGEGGLEHTSDSPAVAGGDGIGSRSVSDNKPPSGV